jgi:histone H3/H4
MRSKVTLSGCAYFASILLVLEEHGTEIATRAIKLARHAGRKTVTGQDIKLAI